MCSSCHCQWPVSQAVGGYLWAIPLFANFFGVELVWPSPRHVAERCMAMHNKALIHHKGVRAHPLACTREVVFGFRFCTPRRTVAEWARVFCENFWSLLFQM